MKIVIGKKKIKYYKKYIKDTSKNFLKNKNLSFISNLYKIYFKNLFLFYLFNFIKSKSYLGLYNVTSLTWFDIILRFLKKNKFSNILSKKIYKQFFLTSLMAYSYYIYVYKYLKKINKFFFKFNKFFIYYLLFSNKYILKKENKKKMTIYVKNKLYIFKNFYYQQKGFSKKKKIYFKNYVTPKFLPMFIDKREFLYRYNFLKYFYLVNSNRILLFYLFKTCFSSNMFDKILNLKNFPFTIKKIKDKYVYMYENKYNRYFKKNFIELFNRPFRSKYKKIKVKESYNLYRKNFFFFKFNLYNNNKFYKSNRIKVSKIYNFLKTIEEVEFPVNIEKKKISKKYIFVLFLLKYIYKIFNIKYIKYFTKYVKNFLWKFFYKKKYNYFFNITKYMLYAKSFVYFLHKEYISRNYLAIFGIKNLYLIYQIGIKYKKKISYYFFGKLSSNIVKNAFFFITPYEYNKVYFKSMFVNEYMIKNETNFFNSFSFYLKYLKSINRKNNKNKFNFDKIYFLLKKVINKFLSRLCERYKLKYKFIGKFFFSKLSKKLIYNKISKKFFNFNLSYFNKKFVIKFVNFFIVLFNKKLIKKINDNFVSKNFSKSKIINQKFLIIKNKKYKDGWYKRSISESFTRNFYKKANKFVNKFINIILSKIIDKFIYDSKKKKKSFNYNFYFIQNFFKFFLKSINTKIIEKKFVNIFNTFFIDNKFSLRKTEFKKRRNCNKFNKYYKKYYNIYSKYLSLFSLYKNNDNLNSFSRKVSKKFWNTKKKFLSFKKNTWNFKQNKKKKFFVKLILNEAKKNKNILGNFNENKCKDLKKYFNKFRKFNNVFNRYSKKTVSKKYYNKYYKIFWKVRKKKKIFYIKNKEKKRLYFFFNKFYNLYFYWYIFYNNNYLKFLKVIIKFIWYSFFFLFNKITFFFLEFYFKNINYFFSNKLGIKLEKNSIFDYYINNNNLNTKVNYYILKKLSLNWFSLSKAVFMVRNYFSIFDNIQRFYKIFLVKKRKKLSISLPYYIFKPSKFYYKKGKRFSVKSKKLDNISLVI
jgi:hypothetical protein